ncbi:MAG: beta-ketoacyl-[acyl-carrier-protein] synthase family protein, partial [Alphaproteobacteria bacterium]|nr:beta-ketoacyl-[acyl-carrier-protein] synthase family protein [Alphaproteobacteria bacterium]
MKRVAITGLGVVSAIGMNTKDFWHALKNGETGIKVISNILTEG